MNNQIGTHPLCFDDTPEKIINYLKKIINYKTFEIINFR